MAGLVPITGVWRQPLAAAAVALGVLGVVVGCNKEEEKKEEATGMTPEAPMAATPAPKVPKPSHSDTSPDPTDGPIVDRVLLEKIAHGLRLAAPAGGVGGVGGAAGRDAAAEKLGAINDLLDNADEHILWGAMEADKGVDPESYRMMLIHPMVWAKTYLACFAFTGPFTLRQEGEFGVLEMAATFRADLPAGDYPHPLWHSGEEWNSYSGAGAIVLAFYHGSFVAAYRKAGEAGGSAAPVWDRKWAWVDNVGAAQPRTAQAAGVLSATNPALPGVQAAYRRLEPMLQAQGCFKCHAPDNTAGANTLVLLRYPAQAMAARDSIAAVLRENSMPPGDPAKHVEDGIADEATRATMIEAADTWGKLVHEAIEYEITRRGGVPSAPPPPPPPPRMP